jgi:hypothetical protein
VLRQNLNRQVAWPSDHGTWAFFLSPLVIGLVAGGRWSDASSYLVIAAFSGFLLRQPITTLVKIISGRRSHKGLAASVLWSSVYLGIALLHLLGLHLRGFSFVLILAVPGIAVFCWYLVLVARRDERRQKAVEIVGAGVLALSAPAALWIGLEWQDPRGWLLWGLCWIFSTMSIVHVYGRLEQRRTEGAEMGLLRRPARRALGLNSVLLAAVVATSVLTTVPALVLLPFLVQWSETAQAAFAKARPPRPTAIGIRQLVVSTLFTVLFSLIWLA